MKIVKLEAENVKRLKAVEITPNESDALVVIEGRNAQGKSSVLDSISWAIGGKRLMQGKPIRDGEDSAEVRIDLGDLRVKRRWTAGGSSLEVTTKDGAVLKSPQAVLDKLLGAISFDPLAFARMKPKERIASLLEVADVDIDLDAFEDRKAALYEERRDVNRLLKDNESLLKSMPTYGDVEDEETDVAALSSKLKDAYDAQAAVHSVQRDVDTCVARIEQLEASLMAAREDLAAFKSRRDELKRIASECVDIEATSALIESSEDTNQKIRANRARASVEQTVETLTEKTNRLTLSLDELEDEKRAALAAAKMPVQHLGFDETDVTYGAIPFEQASSAEQLRISLGIAMAANPKLRVIRISDGSLLDEDNLQMIRDAAKAADYQVWIERVGQSGNVAVVIEDGEVIESKSVQKRKKIQQDIEF